MTEVHQFLWTSKCQELDPRYVAKVYEGDRRGAERVSRRKESRKVEEDGGDRRERRRTGYERRRNRRTVSRRASLGLITEPRHPDWK